MKISNIKKALYGKSVRIITDDGGFQWLCDSHVAYLMDKSIDLNKGNLLAYMDIEDDKREEWTVTESNVAPVWMDICPREYDDKVLYPIMSVSWMTDLLTIMKTDDGEMVMVKQKQIAPADGKEPLGFVLRRSFDNATGELRHPVVACFKDMLACAFIMPMTPETAHDVIEKMKACTNNSLRYCVEMEEDEDWASGVGQAFSPDAEP